MGLVSVVRTSLDLLIVLKVFNYQMSSLVFDTLTALNRDTFGSSFDVKGRMSESRVSQLMQLFSRICSDVRHTTFLLAAWASVSGTRIWFSVEGFWSLVYLIISFLEFEVNLILCLVFFLLIQFVRTLHSLLGATSAILELIKCLHFIIVLILDKEQHIFELVSVDIASMCLNFPTHSYGVI